MQEGRPISGTAAAGPMDFQSGPVTFETRAARAAARRVGNPSFRAGRHLFVPFENSCGSKIHQADVSSSQVLLMLPRSAIHLHCMYTVLSAAHPLATQSYATVDTRHRRSVIQSFYQRHSSPSSADVARYTRSFPLPDELPPRGCCRRHQSLTTD